MKRPIITLLFAISLSLPAGAAIVKLYLKDGTYQLAREYQVNGDRVKFFSTDREEWEEIPLELVDLKKTEVEVKQREEQVREENKANADEDKAERQARREARSVPADPGAYLVNGNTIQPLKAGEAKLVNNKRRSILKVLSPIPMVTGKETLELDAPHSQVIVKDPSPEFYLRLSEDERFGIIKMGERNGHRVVEKVTVVPVSKEVIEEPVIVPIYHSQAGDGLYKIWPQNPLEPGEYAVVEYTDGKINIQVWDFAVASGK
jgi:hypothetical protein